MDWYTIIAIIVLGLWALIATAYVIRIDKALKSRACLYISERENGEHPDLYLEAYEDPSGWTNEKCIVVDIKYYKEKV